LELTGLGDLIAAQGAFGTDFYDRSTRTILGTMLWTENRPVIKIDPNADLGSHEIRPIHSAPSLGQSIPSSQKINSLTDYKEVPEATVPTGRCPIYFTYPFSSFQPRKVVI